MVEYALDWVETIVWKGENNDPRGQICKMDTTFVNRWTEEILNVKKLLKMFPKYSKTFNNLVTGDGHMGILFWTKA